MHESAYTADTAIPVCVGTPHPHTPPSPRYTPPPPMAAFRPDIQALRAVAVLLVVAFHVWPAHVHGGYIGVDVFFVISGYLITGHLVREVASTGRVDLPGFYARRARRLLPAASLTLVVVGLASYLWMPSWTWKTTAVDIFASTLYAENWMLVRRAVDYQAQNETPSPLQHFWSLAVEEQFYFGWPVLVAGVAAVWRLRWARSQTCPKGEAAAFTALQPPGATSSSAPPPPPLALEMVTGGATLSPAPAAAPPPGRAWYAAPMAAACAASFGAALFYARARPEAGYFTTHTRLYELGMGGLLAVLANPQQNLPCSALGTSAAVHRLRNLVALVGLAAIGTSAALFTARTPFPGAAALVPTLGATALLWAGDHQADEGAPPHALVPAMAHPWLQYIGDISYSLYLAHWPVVVIYPFATGRVVEGVLADGVLVCVISFALAHMCKRCWEDRFRVTGSERSTPKQPLANTDNIAACLAPNPGCTYSRRCRPRLSPGVGALVMTLLMVTATLSASLALHAVAPRVAAQGNDALPPAGDDDVPAAAAAEAGLALNTTASPAPARPRLPPSPECDDFFGANATRPYPGAEAVVQRCTTLNSLPVKDLVALASDTHPHGLVSGTQYYPDAVSPAHTWPPAPARLRNIVIWGDSHGKRWHPPFRMVARRLGLNITNLSKSGCAPTLTPLKTRPDPTVKGNVCVLHNTAALDTALRLRPEAVVLIAYV
jgi:peptidoglycan/LPS O-acetylase OafA/YrhL